MATSPLNSPLFPSNSSQDKSSPKISPYIGRFAPSPTGQLHFGSLVGALASFLDARSSQGQWLVRIEDLDPPREILGSSDAILHSLENHHLLWDGPLLYQSHRLDAYQKALEFLSKHHLIYDCVCSRKAITDAGGIYDGHCRRRKNTLNLPTAIRLKVSDLPQEFENISSIISFDDIFMGNQTEDIAKSTGDYVIRRKDGLFAYQLAVVIDDIFQNITHVIRGSDLLSSTGQQIFLFRLLNKKAPQYGHCPVVLNQLEQKLSKQNHAEPLNEKKPSSNIFRALTFLQQNPPQALENECVESIIEWGIQHWKRETIPKINGIQENNIQT